MADATLSGTPARRSLVATIRRAREVDPIAWVAFLILAAAVLSALLAPWIAPHPPLQQNFGAVLAPPSFLSDSSAGYLLGTDPLGRDVLSRLIYGARISLLVGAVTVLLRGVLGVSIGLLAGYYRGITDDVLMRIADIQLALPFLIVAIALLVVLGPGLINLILVLGLAGWVYFARVVRSEVLSLRQRDFVEAARAAGASDWYIIRRHVFPNTLSEILVIGTLEIATIMISEASLSFLGLGVSALTPTWGKEIADGRNYVGQAWWLPVFPGIALFLTVLAINIVGDWLRDRLDPHLRRGARG